MNSIKKVAVVGLKRKVVEARLGKYGLILSRKKPEAVICFGGDGTLLYGERVYPGVPKLMLRHSKTCMKCDVHSFSDLSKLNAGRFKILEEMKIEADIDGKRLVGLNDINIHYKPPHALRFSVYVNGSAKKAIGDGVVVSTPFGSSAYFRSITRKAFSKGIGIAFNNPTTRLKHVIAGKNSKIVVKILRGSGVVVADNCAPVPVKAGSVIRIREHSKCARIIKLD